MESGDFVLPSKTVLVPVNKVDQNGSRTESENTVGEMGRVDDRYRGRWDTLSSEPLVGHSTRITCPETFGLGEGEGVVDKGTSPSRIWSVQWNSGPGSYPETNGSGKVVHTPESLNLQQVTLGRTLR